MNIIGVQLVLLFFGFFMMYVLYTHWRKKNIGKAVFIGWLGLWLIFLIFTMFPEILEPLIKELFIVRVMDLGMIGSFMILTYVTIENNIKIKRYEKEIEAIVRKLAIQNGKRTI